MVLRSGWCITTRMRRILLPTAPPDGWARDGVSIRHRPGAVTELDLHRTDQPALRALMTLLWDVGHDVLSITTIEERSS